MELFVSHTGMKPGCILLDMIFKYGLLTEGVGPTTPFNQMQTAQDGFENTNIKPPFRNMK